MQYNDNTILIVPSAIKKDILLRIDKLINIKVYTIDELIKKYYFDYDKKTIYYVSKKYNVNSEIAKIYIDNLYYISDIDEEKITFLKILKEDLINNKLLIFNNLFKESIKGKKLEFISIPNTLYNNKVIDELKTICNVNIKENKKNNYKHKYKHFKTLEEEVVFTASKICELITKGVDINNIYITNLSDEHRLNISRIFSLFNIPYKIDNDTSIYGTPLVTKFLENYNSDIKVSLDLISNNINSKEDEYIYNNLINIVNSYYFIDDYEKVKYMVINDIKNTKLNTKLNNNCVKEVSFLDHIFKDDDYVFLLHVNQGIFPRIYKDENYLNDKIMSKLKLDTAPFKNKLEKQRVKDSINNIKNLYISYIDSSLKANYYPSSIIEELQLEEELTDDNYYIYSNTYNKIKLTSFLNSYYKYNAVNSYLPILNNSYSIKKYDNSFKGINNANLIKYLNNQLNLSYTSLNNYYKCSFRYYLGNILKLDIYEDTFMQIVGDIFHYILENYFKKEISFDEIYKKAINSFDYEYTLKDRFFLKKLKSELQFIIETIEEQNNYTNLKNELYEENIVTNIKGNISIKFSGKIDKIKYIEKDDETIVAIIDYKTGNPELDLNNVIYGLDMQLPIYIYLAKNSKLKNVKVAGFYLQKILNNEIIADNKNNYIDLKKDKLKLQGYSNSDYSIISEFDTSYKNSKVIRALNVTDNGFGYYSKVISSKDMDSLVSIVEDKIQNCANDIINGNFNINPKSIKDKNVGCQYCKFKSICYMKEKDINTLEEYRNLEFLGGDTNA